MANRYWVLGNGTWNLSATTNWSATSGGSGGASSPTYLDDVYFDVNSNVGTTAWTVTLGTAATCANFNVINPDGVLTIDKGTANVNTLTVYGSYNIALSSLTNAANLLTIGTGLIKFAITTQSSSVFSLTAPVVSNNTLGPASVAETPITIDIGSSYKTLIGKNNQLGSPIVFDIHGSRIALATTNVAETPITIDIGSSYKTLIGKNNQLSSPMVFDIHGSRIALGTANASAGALQVAIISTASTATISYNVFALGYNRVLATETFAPIPTVSTISSSTVVIKDLLSLNNLPKVIFLENLSPTPAVNDILAVSSSVVGRDVFSRNDLPKTIVFEKFAPDPIILDYTSITGLINQRGSTLNLNPVNINVKFGETITNGITPLPYQFWG